ncbi:MAG: DUF1328 domain-containing protein [Candidatus Paceibacterota bacterium]
MLAWTLTFFILTLVTGVLGFTNVALASSDAVKILFVVFTVLFLTSFFIYLADKTEDVLDRNS